MTSEMRNGIMRGLGMAVLLAMILLPLLMTSIHVYFVTLVLVYVIAAVGLNILMGYTGQISVAHAAFMGIGAYTAALLMSKLQFHVLPALCGGMLVSAAFGFLVGIPALRIRGHYLALATLAFQLIVEAVILNWIELTRGPNGLRVPAPMLGPWKLANTPLYYFVLLLLVAAFLFSANLLRSRVGRALISIRDHELAAQVMGINITWYKTLAFGLSSAYAGLAGGLFGLTVAFLDPLAFTIWESIRHLIMVIFGGLGTLVGPVIGAALVSSAPELLRGFREYSAFVFYVILLVFLVFMPGGLVSGFSRLWSLAVPRWNAGSGIRAEGAGRPAESKSLDALDLPPIGVAAGDTLLDVSGIKVEFGGLKALRDVSFTVKAGEIAGLIGPNGAGKTTLFNVLTRVYQPTGGSLRFKGEDVLKADTHGIAAIGISRTFQNVEMFGTMTVLENVLVGMHHTLRSGLFASGLSLPAQRREEREAVARAMEILDFLDLRDIAGARASQLPLGIQRRVELARALATRPQLLLLDEPASGLSHAEAERLMADVRAIRAAGVTILLIEHNMQFVMNLCESIRVLDQGEVICIGTPAEANSNPRVIEAYLGKEEPDHADS